MPTSLLDSWHQFNRDDKDRTLRVVGASAVWIGAIAWVIVVRVVFYLAADSSAAIHPSSLWSIAAIWALGIAVAARCLRASTVAWSALIVGLLLLPIGWMWSESIGIVGITAMSFTLLPRLLAPVITPAIPYLAKKFTVQPGSAPQRVSAHKPLTRAHTEPIDIPSSGGDPIESVPKPAPKPLPPARSLDECLADLDAMIGLGDVKCQVRELIAFLEMQKQRKGEGLKPGITALNLLFYGPPGTGKTEIARQLGQILRAMGWLKRGHLVETSRADLVGRWQGVTEIQTKAKVEEALNGVLLVDEAHTLWEGGEGNSFGNIATGVLNKAMEDERESLVVIATGYEREMAKWLESDPGLRSRFTRSITFVPYTTDELIAIADKMARDSEYEVDDRAGDDLARIFDLARLDGNFGNGRYARKLLEAAMAAHALRLQGQEATRGEMMLLTTEDFIEAEKAVGTQPEIKRLDPLRALFGQ